MNWQNRFELEKEVTQLAGTVFRPETKPAFRATKPRKRYRSRASSETKLHKLANQYRPKETK